MNSSRRDSNVELTRRVAELAVRVGANVQPGQEVLVGASIEHAEMAREIVRECYRAGAKYAYPLYADQHVRRALAELGPEDALDYTPSWVVESIEYLSRTGGTLIATTGEADLMVGLDPARVARSRMLEMRTASFRLESSELIRWTVVPAPNEGWAQAVFGTPDVDRLWAAVAAALRLDNQDPIRTWNDRLAELARRAHVMNERAFDAIRFRGPGTDLTVGLLPESMWRAAVHRTPDGLDYIANLPTEEVFATPDRGRTQGRVRVTRPLNLRGPIAEGVEMRFESGRIVEVTATKGADLIRSQLEADEAARYLGEIALVDGTSGVGRTQVTFQETLLDENATCHLAFGSGWTTGVRDGGGLSEDELRAMGVNVATVHVDFMVGGPEVEVDALDRQGQATPLLRDDVWQLD